MQWRPNINWHSSIQHRSIRISSSISWRMRNILSPGLLYPWILQQLRLYKGASVSNPEDYSKWELHFSRLERKKKKTDIIVNIIWRWNHGSTVGRQKRSDLWQKRTILYICLSTSKFICWWRHERVRITSLVTCQSVTALRSPCDITSRSIKWYPLQVVANMSF